MSKTNVKPSGKEALYKPLANPDLKLSQKEIVVAARCRTMLPEEISGSCSNIVRVSGTTSSGYRVLITEPPPSYQEIPFTFDLAYQDHIDQVNNELRLDELEEKERSQQERAVNDIGSLMIHAGWTGQSVSVFAHGARKTGKSYIIFGKQDRTGLVSRVIEDLFYRIKRHTQKENEDNNLDENRNSKTEFVVTFSMLEVYLEKIRDLLAVPVSADAEEHISVRMSASVGATGLRVCENNQSSSGSIVADLTRIPVNRLEDVLKCLVDAEDMINLDIRKMNPDSRGHIIAQVNLSVTETVLSVDENGERHKSQETRFSNIRFCDMAEFEKPLLEKHQPKCHMREIKLKNKGILCVENCLRAVAAGQTHPKHPQYLRYKLDSRSSLVSRVMFDASKFILINCFSPADFDFSASFSTLQYGQRCFSDRRDTRGQKKVEISPHVLHMEIEDTEILLKAERKKAVDAEEELLKLKQVHADQLVSTRNELDGVIARNENIIRMERENDALSVEIKDLDVSLSKYSSRAQELLAAGFSLDLAGEIFRLKQKIAETRHELEVATRKKTKELELEREARKLAIKTRRASESALRRTNSHTGSNSGNSGRASLSSTGQSRQSGRPTTSSGSVNRNVPSTTSSLSGTRPKSASAGKK